MNIQQKKELEITGVDQFKESKTDRLQDLFITAGDRSSVIGSQNGLFPDFGHHVKDEMGGVWAHPIKLLDGYWLHVKEEGDEQGFWLKEADRFHNYPFYNEHDYSLNDRHLEIVRRQFCPDGIEGVVVSYFVKNIGDSDRQFDFSFLGRTELSPVWFSETLGMKMLQMKANWMKTKVYLLAMIRKMLGTSCLAGISLLKKVSLTVHSSDLKRRQDKAYPDCYPIKLSRSKREKLRNLISLSRVQMNH